MKQKRPQVVSERLRWKEEKNARRYYADDGREWRCVTVGVWESIVRVEALLCL